MSHDYKQFFKAAQEAKSGVKMPPPSFKIRPKNPTSAPLKRDPEARVRHALGKTAKKREPFPWRAVTVLSLTLATLGFYVAAPEVCERWFRKVEFSAFGQATASEKGARSPAEKAKAKLTSVEKTAAKSTTETRSKNPDETHTTAGDLPHFEKLKQRKEELDMREKELSQLEEELQRQKVELDKRITQLEEMRGQIAQVLKDRVEIDQEKVTKLVDLYSNMKPKQAAEVLGNINEDLAVEVLAKMKKKSAAEIMNLLPAEKAKVLSEKYTGYRRSHASEPKG